MHFILTLTHLWYSTICSSTCNCTSGFEKPARQGLTNKFTHAQYHELHHGCGSQDSILSLQYDPQQGINKKYWEQKTGYQILLKIGVIILRNEVVKTITSVLLLLKFVLMYVMFNYMNQEDDFLLRSLLFMLGGLPRPRFYITWNLPFAFGVSGYPAEV